MKKRVGNVGVILGAAALVITACDRPETPQDLGVASQTQTAGADFVVSAVTGPTSVLPGQSFTAMVTVCNQGTMGDSTDVELYLSTDNVITPPVPPNPPTDMPVGSTYVGYLNPGQCQTLPLPVSANVPSEGAYYLGAAVDPRNNRPESNESNNTKAGSRIGIGNKADFIVTAVTGPTSAQLGQPFTASVTVCNQGTMSDGTDVELYLSTDNVITPPVPPNPPTDMPVGRAPTPYLNPGQCQTVSVPVSANAPSEGAYYLGAAVDPNNSRPELIEDNNTKAGSRIGIGNKADFIVTAVTGPTSAQLGQPFTSSVTVCNQGTMGDSTDVELYLSTDSIITPPVPPNPPTDMPLGRVPTPYLNPGQCQTLSMPVSANAPSEGAYYLGAAADPNNNRPELIEDNNTKAGSRIGIGNKPDFVVTAVTTPSSITMNQSFTAMVTVCNQGTMSDSTDVGLFLSSDSIITPPVPPDPPTDQPVGSTYVSYLNPGQCQTLPVSVSVWVPSEGAYYLGAVVDPNNNRPEFIEDNNTKVGGRIGIGNKADFVVTAVTGPTSAQLNQSFTASVTVCNQGTMGDSTDVELYLSSDNVITPPTPPGPPTDFPLGRIPVNYLNPGQCQTQSLPASGWVPSEGAYYLGAVVDPNNNRPELIEDNNAKAGSRIGIGSKPDFVVTAVTGPASMRMNQSFDASVTVCNQGTMGGSTDVELYLSSDNVITPASPSGPFIDYPQGRVYMDMLNPGQCRTQTVSVPGWVPSEGAYYLGAVVDPRDYMLELIEDNNTKAGSRIGIGTLPDYVVTAVTGPASTQMGQSITASVTVCNQGTMGGGTDVELYLSSDDIITPATPPAPPADFPLGRISTDPLAAGQCQTLSVPVSVYAPSDGTYYLGAVADPRGYQPELIEDNNAKAGSRIGIGTLPDFTVTAVTGPASTQMGQQLTASVTVCNQGTMGGSTDVELYLSSDKVITPAVTPGNSPDVPLARTSTNPLYPGQCQTLPMSVSAWAPTEGAYYLGAAVDPRNFQPELIKDNNTKAGSRIGIGTLPDFTVTAVTAPTSAQLNQQFTASVTVCNQGTTGDSVDVEFFLSADKIITPPDPYSPPTDMLVGHVSSDMLTPGQCQTLSQQVYVSAPSAGAYYLGAVADSRNYRPELIEDNNTRISGVISVTQ